MLRFYVFYVHTREVRDRAAAERAAQRREAQAECSMMKRVLVELREVGAWPEVEQLLKEQGGRIIGGGEEPIERRLSRNDPRYVEAAFAVQYRAGMSPAEVDAALAAVNKLPGVAGAYRPCIGGPL